MRYSLDTSALLDGRVRYYPVDVFPGLWSNFELLVNSGGAKATEMVRHELEPKDDDVLKWSKGLNLFINVDEEIQHIVKEILKSHERLASEGSQRSRADPFVIALAKQKSCAVVTAETGGTPEKPKIPSVCRAMGIECITIVELIRRERWRF